MYRAREHMNVKTNFSYIFIRFSSATSNNIVTYTMLYNLLNTIYRTTSLHSCSTYTLYVNFLLTFSNEWTYLFALFAKEDILWTMENLHLNSKIVFYTKYVSLHNNNNKHVSIQIISSFICGLHIVCI